MNRLTNLLKIILITLCISGCAGNGISLGVEYSDPRIPGLRATIQTQK